MEFELNILPGGGVPIFRQIVDQVRLAAATGRLAPGEALPSVRAAAEKLLVNPNTVAKAYGELAREGIIEGQQGRGMFVAPPRQIYTKTERVRRLAPLADALVNEGLSLGFTPAEVDELFQQRLAKAKLPASSRRNTP
jgi:GntR family transcriptional regulator